VEDTHSIQEMPRQFKSQRTIEEEMNINRRTITEITNIVGDSDNKVRKQYLKQYLRIIQLYIEYLNLITFKLKFNF
jgi:Trp operon repressor